MLVKLAVPCIRAGRRLARGTTMYLPDKMAASLIHKKYAVPMIEPRKQQTVQPSEKRHG